MARHRKPAERPAPLALPEHLTAPCWVEDWVDPHEQPPGWWCSSTINGVGVDTTREDNWLMLAARRRWKQAREQWAADHGMTWRAFSGTYAHGAPRWRDRQTFNRKRVS